MKLYTYAGNTHALQTLIVARYNGIDIEVRRRCHLGCFQAQGIHYEEKQPPPVA
jgi:hypothetical protein